PTAFTIEDAGTLQKLLGGDGARRGAGARQSVRRYIWSLTLGSAVFAARECFSETGSCDAACRTTTEWRAASRLRRHVRLCCNRRPSRPVRPDSSPHKTRT